MNKKILLTFSALAIFAAVPAFADVTSSVTTKTNTLNTDGSVSFESHTVVNKDSTVTAGADAKPFVTFYYYNPANKKIMSGYDLTDDIIFLWDADSNKVIDNHEFYTDALVMYEPMEYSKRTYQDINADGVAELTREEYTMRLQKLPAYSQINANKKDGLTLYEFTGVGFQDADINNDNQVSVDELKEAFYHQKGLAPMPEKTNK